MLKFTTLVLDIVQRVLEGYLLIWTCAIKLRQHLLHGLEVEKVEWISHLVQKFLYSLLVDMFSAVERTLTGENGSSGRSS